MFLRNNQNQLKIKNKSFKSQQIHVVMKNRIFQNKNKKLNDKMCKFTKNLFDAKNLTNDLQKQLINLIVEKNTSNFFLEKLLKNVNTQ